MYSRFNLSTTNDYKEYQHIGKRILSEGKKYFEEEFEKYIDSNGTIDGSSLESAWFPLADADIFLSHSHKDEDKAMGLAGWLFDTFGLKVFIDSCVWGYSLDLQKKIDNNYCLNDDKTAYDYDKRNYSTSHVHMMLSIALTKMIDKTECIIFLNTKSSITSTDVIINKTESPWLYHEIAMTSLVRTKHRDEYRKELIHKGYYSEERQLNIEYRVDLSGLEPLEQEDLYYWGNLYKVNNDNFPLDILYYAKGLTK